MPEDNFLKKKPDTQPTYLKFWQERNLPPPLDPHQKVIKKAKEIISKAIRNISKDSK